MTGLERWLLVIYGVIVAVWVVRHVVVTWIFAHLEYLTLASPGYQGSPCPLVSVIIPAKDEQDHLGECIGTVLGQTYRDLEVLIVDDRSRDRTGAIARELARTDPRVRVITIEELPAGWTGKTHALHVASTQARGGWLWFIDADTRHAPESLSIALEYGRVNRAELVSILPEMRCETFWERAVQPLMGIVLMRSYPMTVVNDDASDLGFANGQYLLIHRPAYDAVGGHAAVRDRFLEDIALAKRVKALGLPIRVAIGTQISSTRMYISLDQICRGWSRILYDGLGRTVWPLVGKIVEPLIWSQPVTLALGAVGYLALAGRWSRFASWLLLLALVHLVLQISVLYRFYRLQSPRTAWSAVWYPLAGYVSDWILFKSIMMCFTGRVVWRGTSYSRASESASDQTGQTG